MSYVVEVDERGRIVIPKKVRDSLKIGRRVRMKVEGNKIVIEPIEDPLDKLTSLVKGSKLSSDRAGEIGRIAYKRLLREAGG